MSTEQTMTDTMDLIESAATDILTLVEGLDAQTFARSRVTRQTALSRLREIAGIAAALSEDSRSAMPEVDWRGWASLHEAFAHDTVDAAWEWLAASELAAVILQWIRVYRQAV